MYIGKGCRTAIVFSAFLYRCWRAQLSSIEDYIKGLFRLVTEMVSKNFLMISELKPLRFMPYRVSNLKFNI